MNWGNDVTTDLPRINNFVMIATPNLGAPKAYNPIQDNWDGDIVYKYVFSKVIYLAYEKLAAGETIYGPTPDSNIQLSGVSNPDGTFNYQEFLQKYVPTIYSLLPTYPFLDPAYGQPPTTDPSVTNNLLPALDVEGWAQELEENVQQVTDIYGTGVSTVVSVTKEVGPIPYGIVGQTGAFVYLQSIFPFNAYSAQVPDEGQTWYQNNSQPLGDGTVPVASSDPFMGDTNVEQFPAIVGTNVSHQELPSNEDAQADVLQALGIIATDYAGISTGLSLVNKLEDLGEGTGVLGWVISYVFDPVGAVLTDDQGRRLGYTPVTGPLEEIPDSVFLGDSTAGFALAFGEGPVPTQFQLTGLGGPYSVLVSGQDGSEDFGAIESGTLASGQGQPVTLTPAPPSACPPARRRLRHARGRDHRRHKPAPNGLDVRRRDRATPRFSGRRHRHDHG